MSQRWTKRQTEAIQLRDQNLLISAGAGSGKTAVMTERVVSLILEGTDLKNMLLVTFTNASATEMKRRIQLRLGELLADEATDRTTWLRARSQLESFSQANISTLHSFCKQVLRRHFHAVSLDPSFRIGDEYETAILAREAIEEVTEYLFECEESNFIQLDETLGNAYDGLEQTILTTYRFMMTMPDPWEWLERTIDFYAMNQEELKANAEYNNLCKEAQEILLQATESLKKARELVPLEEEHDVVRARLAEEEMSIRAVAMQFVERAEQLPSYKDIFLTMNFSRKKDASPIDKEEIKSLREEAKQCWKSIEKYEWSTEKQTKKMNEMLPVLRGLQTALERYHRLYQKKKSEKNLLDFSDLEHYALQALQEESIANEYREKFHYVFIDEYQDSSGIQEQIIERISRTNNLFCVGDSKQSIYRFRAAEPALFLEREKRYQEGDMGKVIYLNQNFRSNEGILNSVNDIFRIIMPLGKEQTYLENDMLYAGREKSERISETTVCIISDEYEIEEENEVDEVDEKEDVNKIQIEALQMVSYIQQRIGKSIIDINTGEERKITYRDFAILLRSVRNSAEVIARTLSEAGIPSYADLSGGYFDALEIQVLMNLLRLIDNRRQDIAWLSILRAGFFSFCDQDIVELCKIQERESIWHVLEQCAKGNGETARKCQMAIMFLDEAKERSLAMRLSSLVEWVIEKTEYETMIASQNAYDQRRANIEAFLKSTQTYEGVSARGLGGFLAFLDGFREAGEDMGEARLSGEGTDCVRIVSIHKSKGLEYPIVLIGQCGKRRNQTDQTRPMILHKKQGIGLKYINTKTRAIGDTFAWQMARAEIERESIAEEIRVLYVGMTRAMNELILIGTQKAGQRDIERWQKKGTMRTILDFIMTAIMQTNMGRKWCQQMEMPIRKGMFLDAEGKWNIQIVNPSTLVMKNQLEKKYQTMQILLKKNEHVDTSEIRKYMQWQYQHEPIPGKIAVSALTKGQITLDTTPKFLSDKQMTSADRGTAMHAFLQHMDWKQSLDDHNIREQAKSLVIREILSEEQYAVLSFQALTKFVTSSLGQRMSQADYVTTERTFTMQADISELYEDGVKGTTTVQGIIDAYFMEGNEWVLIDYKTDYINWNEEIEEEVAQRYALQVQLYADALMKTTNKRVKERWIVFLSSGRALLIEEGMIAQRPRYLENQFLQAKEESQLQENKNE